jgi:hypothetical protein
VLCLDIPVRGGGGVGGHLRLAGPVGAELEERVHRIHRRRRKRKELQRSDTPLYNRLHIFTIFQTVEK